MARALQISRRSVCLYNQSLELGKKRKNRNIFTLRSRVSMAASTDFSSGREAVVRRQSRGPPYKFLVPLIYAPVLPLIRIGLRHKPVLRERLFFGVLAGAFLHGAYLIYGVSLGGCTIRINYIFSLLICNWLHNFVSDLYDAESK